VETQLVQVERIDIAIDRPNRIVSVDVILQTSRQKACLIAAQARFVSAVRRRHAGKPTLARGAAREFLPSLYAPPALRPLTLTGATRARLDNRRHLFS
jgi:hypothetical protein